MFHLIKIMSCQIGGWKQGHMEVIPAGGCCSQVDKVK